MIAAACSAVVLAAPPSEPTAGQLHGFPKNIARQHYSTNLSLYDSAAQKYVPNEAAAAWLDDDVATGWPALAGKQHYLIQFAEAQLVTNLDLSAKPSKGTLSIYTGDTDAAPGDKAWTLVAKDVAIDSINNQKLARPINKFAKYVLLETNIANPDTIYSLNIFGERAAVTTAIVSRPQAVDTKPLLGDFVNNQTAFNMAGLYAKSLVTYSNAAGTNASWQRAIDDDPETSTAIKPSTAESGMVVRFGGEHPFSRLSLLSNPNSRGKLDIFLLSEAPEAGAPVSLEGVAPSTTLTFDGTTPRASADFAETKASAMAFRWTPDGAAAPLAIREVNIFADLSLSDYEVGGAPATIAKGPDSEGSEKKKNHSEGDSIADGKSIVDGKSIADGKAPIGQGPRGIDNKGVSAPPGQGSGPNRPGFSPGGLGFPPNLPNRIPVSN